MRRGMNQYTVVALIASLLASGCRPTQPFFFGEDGSLSRYVDKATKIETADVCTTPNDEVMQSRPPLTLDNANFDQTWPLSLQEAVKDVLANGKVLRSLGGRFATEGSPTAPQTGEAPNALLTNPTAAPRSTIQPSSRAARACRGRRLASRRPCRPLTPISPPA